jgi:hypothetical protein
MDTSPIHNHNSILFGTKESRSGYPKHFFQEVKRAELEK